MASPAILRALVRTLICPGCTLVVVLACTASLAADDPAVFFPQASSDSLAAQLRVLDAVEAGLHAGLTIERTIQAVVDPSAVVVKNQLVNRSNEPVSVAKVVLLNGRIDTRRLWENLRFQPLAYRAEVWYGSTFWSGPDWTRVGRDWHHSGERTSSIRRFVAPRAGRVQIAGRIYKADFNGGDGVHLEIRHGDKVVWQADIDAADQTGVEPALALDVSAGDSLRFVVHRRGDIGYDTTHWDPCLTYDNGELFQASVAFDAHEQGSGHWFYEMETDSSRQTELAWPTVHGLHRPLQWFQQSLASPEPRELAATEMLSAWIFASGTDSSGVIACASAPCGLRYQTTAEGDLNLQCVYALPADAALLQPGQSLPLPSLVVADYQNSWTRGVQTLQQLVAASASIIELAPLRSELVTAARQIGAIAAEEDTFELDLYTYVQQDWARQDGNLEDLAKLQAAAYEHLERARLLLDDVRRADPARVIPAAERLETLSARMTQAHDDVDRWRALYQEVRWAKRQIALANPLLDFGPLLFCKRVPTSYSHLVMQYYGFRARPGGGLFVLDRPGRSLACRDLLDGRLAHGNVLEPRLSYDGTRIAFSFVTPSRHVESVAIESLDNSTDEGFYHIWTANTDGSDLKQLTSGPYDDLMPCWLPDGGIAFSSTRRRGYARCFGGQFSQRWHVYTIHRMEDDGSGMRILSVHDTNEWFPTVLHSGHILYSRWDYIDRDAVTHQNLWAMHPDGTNPVAVWGNATSAPHCAFQAQPIPNSEKILFTASAHHSITAGSLVIVDPSVSDNDHAALVRLTPEVPFPEAESMDIQQYYAAPWPLSERYYLTAYSPTPLVWEPGANAANALGIYLLDASGNRELIYRDPEIGSTNPCPLTSRPMPPAISSSLPADTEPTGEMFLTDVYTGLGEIPRGTIKELRIVQILPKTTHIADGPRVGLAREENARAILGTVPVEADGSAHFIVPALKPLLFQALDENGFAYQTMRTITYVQPGERVACYGCHESRLTAPLNRSALALHRPASTIDPGELGGRPFSYVEMVQPIWDQHCVRCHGPEKKDGQVDLSSAPRDGFTESYWALCGNADFWGAGTNPDTAATAWVPRFGGRNQIQITPPGGLYGARGSRLMKLLTADHYDAKLTAAELRRVAAWIDCNAIFYGVYRPEDQARQLRGEQLTMPEVQ